MFSDNENPGDGNFRRTIRHRRHTGAGKYNCNGRDTCNGSRPRLRRKKHHLPIAPFAAEPAAVTVAPAEPVAAPDGLAAVEHSDVSEMVEADAGEPSTESTAEMEQLMEQYAAPHQAPAEGEIESGQVVAITDLGVVVDLGGKTEGLIPAQEFAELDGPFPLLVGQPVEVQRTGDRKDGMVLLSYQRVRRRRIWSKIEEAYRNKTDITGKVVDQIKGGLVVDIGVRAFLPASQADVHPVRDLDEWKDREVTVRVLKMNRKRGNVVVSRRAILDEQVAAQRQAMLDSMAEGQIVRGVVKNVTGYGAFVDLGGIDGLLHITDMSWGRVASPLDAVRPGEEVEVKILKYDREKGRVSLGRKQLLPDPWASVPERYTDRQEAHRQDHGPDRLRRIRRSGTGHRRPGARQRDELVEAQVSTLRKS